MSNKNTLDDALFEDFPLSYGQQALWFLQDYDPFYIRHNVVLTVKSSTFIQLNFVKKAFQKLVDRHPVLRTTFTSRDGKPVQRVYESMAVSFQVSDTSGLKKDELLARLSLDAKQPFDLERGPLFKVHVFKLSAQEHLWLIMAHHIIVDMWSLSLLLSEVHHFYQAEIENKPASLRALNHQYTDYVIAQEKMLSSAVGDELRSYWQKRLNCRISPLTLPFKKPVKEDLDFQGALETHILNKELTEALRSFSKTHGIPLYVICLAVFQTLLHRYTGLEDILVSYIKSGRTHTMARVMGYFLNNIVLRGNFADQANFMEYLTRLHQDIRRDFQHDEYPFPLLVKDLKIHRDVQNNPLTQVVFSWQKTTRRINRHQVGAIALNIEGRGVQAGETYLEQVNINDIFVPFDFSWLMGESEIELAIKVEYNSSTYQQSGVKLMLEHFETLLASIIINPEQNIELIPYITPSEKQLILKKWNETEVSYPALPIHRLIEAQVRRAPHAPAVRFEGESLTYAEMNTYANQIAHSLIQKGVKRGDVVGVYLERSLALVPALLGVMKAGGAYLPMDPILPPVRLGVMLGEAEAKIVLTQESLRGTLPEGQYRIISLDDRSQLLRQQPEENPEVEVDLDDIAYIIFTSGSTGKPKGVEVLHQGLTNFMMSMQREPGMQARDVMASVTTITFDIAEMELFLPLISGAQVVIVPTLSAMDGQALGEILEKERVTILQGTPATWRLLVQAGWRGKAGLKMLCGGEALSTDLARELLERKGELWNMYGPTETTIWSTCARVQDPEQITIGRPIANTHIYILDENREIVPIGVPGRLYIGGDGLARGYVKQPALTAERFIIHPNESIQERVYDTGDMARWMPDGRIKYLGRQDSQVKIRGFRIELEGVATHLRSHPAVEKAIVTAVGETTLSKRMVAYLVPKVGMIIEAKSFRPFLHERIPEYMIPSHFEVVDSIPLKPNGKVDYASLPDPKQFQPIAGANFLAPRNHLERVLAKIWEEVLEISPIGIQDNFFEIGGHSLLTIHLLSRIRETLGLELPVMMIFQAPTVEKLADAIQTNVEFNFNPHAVQIVKGDNDHPFFCVHGFGGGVVDYIWLARLLEPLQTFYGLEAQGIDGQKKPHETIEEIAAYAIECMKAVQPTGPYLLGGYCYGGVIAFEMTRQLEALGEKVALLAIFEGYAPIRSRFFQNIKIGALITFINNLPFWFSDFMQLDFSTRKARIRRVLHNIQNSLQNRDQLTSEIKLADFLDNPDRVPEIRRKIMETQLKASFLYEPEPIKTKITLFRGRRMSLRRSFDPKMGWGNLSQKGVELKMIEGSHLEVIVEPLVRSLAKQLSESIAAAKIDLGI